MAALLHTQPVVESVVRRRRLVKPASEPEQSAAELVIREHNERLMQRLRLLPLPGQRFGRLVVLRQSKTRKQYLLCQCDCGVRKEVYKYYLLNGETHSCGNHPRGRGAKAESPAIQPKENP